MARRMSVDVVIPVEQPDAGLAALLAALSRQSVSVGHVLILNKDEKLWDPKWTLENPEAEVFHVGPEQFRPGVLENTAADFVSADLMVLLSPEITLAGDRTLSKLIRPFRYEEIKMSYGALLPTDDSGRLDGMLLTVLFPEESAVKSAEDAREEGIFAYFATNRIAAFEMKTLRALGGFPAPCPVSEEKRYAGKLFENGFSVAYCPGAAAYVRERNSHLQAFQRAFDEGASEALFAKAKRLPKVGMPEGALEQLEEQLVSEGQQAVLPRLRRRIHWIKRGYSLGRKARRLPGFLCKLFSANKAFWTQN